MRSNLLVLFFACSVIAVPTASAALADVEIKVARQKLDQDVNTRGNKRIETKEIRYTVTVQSKTFKQLSNLEAKYIIFYYDSQPGSPDKPVEQFKSGSEKIVALAGNRSVEFQTDSIALTTVTLDGGWYYEGGGSNKSKDRVSGIWVRIYSEGKIIGEYAAPVGITKRDWKD